MLRVQMPLPLPLPLPLLPATLALALRVKRPAMLTGATAAVAAVAPV